MRNFDNRFRLENGKWAYIQNEAYENAARQHCARIAKLWHAPRSFYHLRPGGHVAAVRRHLRNRVYAKVDLSNFFGNVTRSKVARSLKSIGYRYRDADDFAVASTVCVNHGERRFALPYGFVQSPLLASVVMDKSELGACIRRLRTAGTTISVYVDDIIISHDDAEAVTDAYEAIRAAAATSNFPINEGKSRPVSDALRAFNIDFDAEGMAVAPDRFEAMCRIVLMTGDSAQTRGIAGYVRTVNPDQADQLAKDFPRSFPKRQQHPWRVPS